MNTIKTLLLSALLITSLFMANAQNLQVETIVNLNASGGVTFGPDGNVYVSDFGPALGTASSNTKVYKLEYGTWEVTEFASGFSGASGACFDSKGNFFQSNPSGGRVSKVSLDGTVDLNWARGFGGPIGIVPDPDDNLYACICGSNSIRKILPDGSSTQFASSSLFRCPNGITRDPDGNLYVCNFNDGRILKVDPNGTVSLFANLAPLSGVGNGHLTYSNGFLFVATIGGGEIYKLTLDGQGEKIAGIYAGFSNNDGPALQATFSKPNGVAASRTGDTLFVNCSVPTWQTSNTALHPGLVRMITGVCSLPDVDCPLLTSTSALPKSTQASLQLFPAQPNPVLTSTTIRYELAAAQELRIRVLDTNNREVLQLVEGRKAAGAHQRELNVANWAPGLYIVLLEGANVQRTTKLLVLAED